MPKQAVIGIIIFLVVAFLIGGGAFLVMAQKNANQTFDLYLESGQVLVKEQNKGDYQEVKQEKTTHKNHTFIKTEGGFAHVILPNKSMMSIDKNSEVQVNLDGNSTNINQVLGNTWHRIQKLTGKEEYNVETSTALASVRGTKFAVLKNSNEESKILDIEGRVEASQMVLEKGKKVKKNSKLMEPNRMAKVKDFNRNPQMEIEDMPEDEKKSDWFKRNIFIDQEFDKGFYGPFVVPTPSPTPSPSPTPTPSPSPKPVVKKVQPSPSPTPQPSQVLGVTNDSNNPTPTPQNTSSQSTPTPTPSPELKKEDPTPSPSGQANYCVRSTYCSVTQKPCTQDSDCKVI